jgi:hypothetical protein
MTQKELERLVVLRKRSNHQYQTWIDFTGLLVLVNCNRNWFFLRPVINRMTERYGENQFVQIRCCNIIREESSHISHATNLDSKKIMCFLISKANADDQSNEADILALVGN